MKRGRVKIARPGAAAAVDMGVVAAVTVAAAVVVVAVIVVAEGAAAAAVVIAAVAAVVAAATAAAIAENAAENGINPLHASDGASLILKEQPGSMACRLRAMASDSTCADKAQSS